MAKERTVLFWLLACGGDPVETVPEGPQKVVVYSGRSESLMAPIFEKAAAATGLELDIQYGDTPALISRLAMEGAASPADVVLAQEVGHLDAVSAQLAPLPADVLAPVDPRFRSTNWVGTSGRLRVLVLDPDQVPVEERPTSLADLADPKWKGRLGWAPTNGSMQSHLGALCHLWGEPQTRTWLAGVKANEPRRFPKNSPQVAAADRGELAVGWVNHYYLHRKGEQKHAKNYSFPKPGDAGNILMLAGAAVRDANNPGAFELVRYLVSEEAQSYFAQKVYEYPTRPGVETHSAVPALTGISLAPVEPKALTDLSCARRLLDEADLL